MEDAQNYLMLKQKIRSLSLCFVSLHFFCWINSENVEHICHILKCVWMRFSWNLRIISEKWLCFTVSFFEPGEVINSSGLPTQRSLFGTSLNLRIQCVYSGSEQNSFRLFVNFVISTDLYKQTDLIILSYLSGYLCYFSRGRSSYGQVQRPAVEVFVNGL